jgi:hypothetical protein
MISESFVEAANATSVESPATTDEWILSGLTPEPSVSVDLSFPLETPIGMNELPSNSELAFRAN